MENLHTQEGPEGNEHAPQIEPPIAHARRVLSDMNATYPGAWRMADTARAIRKRMAGDSWPDWCFLPSFEAETIMQVTSTSADPFRTAHNVAVFTAMAAWRLTQGTYCFDREVAGEIMATPFWDAAPISFIYQLPQWCVFVETQALALSFFGQPVHGFFAHIDRSADGSDQLHILLVTDTTHQITIPVGDMTVREALSSLWLDPGDEGTPNRLEHCCCASKVIALLMFICCHPDEISGPAAEGPSNPLPKRTRDGWRLFAVRSHTRWYVALNTGEILRKAGILRPGVAPGKRRQSIRKPYWHGIKAPSGVEGGITMRWIPPLPANVGSIEDLRAIGRPSM